MREASWLGMVALCAALASHAAAVPRELPLAPGSAEVSFRAYGLGFLPIDGRFTRWAGTLALDASAPGACWIDLRAETASLQMPAADMTADAQGPDLLDVARHPLFEYAGRCNGSQLEGTLLLHGVRRPLVLQVTRDARRWSASGMMRRADWGMGARPNLAGPEVRIRFTVALPPGFPGGP